LRENRRVAAATTEALSETILYNVGRHEVTIANVELEGIPFKADTKQVRTSGRNLNERR
jgi:hypothetical protein